MTIDRDLIDSLRTSAEQQIEAARFVLSRMRNAPVLADSTGHCVLRDGGCWPIPAECGRVAMFKDAASAKIEAAAQNEELEMKGVSFRLIAMSFHKAARLQIERAEGIIAQCDEAIAKADAAA